MAAEETREDKGKRGWGRVLLQGLRQLLVIAVWPLRNWRCFGGSRARTRLLVVGGVLLFVLTWRLDQAVKTAYDTRWFAPSERGTPLACESCLRLPSSGWVWVYGLATVFAFAAIFVAVLMWRLRCVKETGTKELFWTTAVGFAVIGISAGFAVYFRLEYASGRGQHGTTIVVSNVFGIAAAIAVALMATNLRYQAHRKVMQDAIDAHRESEGKAAAAAAKRTDAGTGAGDGNGAPPTPPRPLEPPSLKSSLGRFVKRQRLNLILVVALALLLTVVGDTSGQAIDSIRSWSPLPSPPDEVTGVSGPARLLMGLASSLLFALVLYESGLRLTQAAERSTEMRIPLLRALAGVALVGGLLCLLVGDFGRGFVVAGAVIALVLLLEWPALAGPELEVEPPDLLRAEQRAPEWLAITPLLAFAATSVAAFVDAALSGGLSWRTGFILAPAVALGLLAVLMTSERLPPALLRPSNMRTAAVALVPIGAAPVLVWLGSRDQPAWLHRLNWPAIVGGLTLLLLVGYSIWLFRAAHGQQPQSEGLTSLPVGIFTAYATPLAVGSALGVLIAIHLNPIETGRTLGVLALANIALAAIAVLFLYLVLAAILYRPPRLLWWFGFRQLPVLAFVALWWIVVGLLGAGTLHDVRIVDRKPVLTAAEPESIPAKPTLEDAFDQWVKSQPELVADKPGSRPVPLVLVAAHGGGIRAAYWTASTLDCLVGVSAVGTRRAALENPSTAEQERTCTGTRRTREQQQSAARRIFLMSGVSGGAVGLYAYARQLLHNGQLGGPEWVDQRLSHDFASPAVGWALFHDLPNRLLGLQPDRGGGCRRHFHKACWTDDRAAVLEETFDAAWETTSTEALLRRTYDLRFSKTDTASANAKLVPVIVANSTLTGGHTRAVSSAIDLGAWPQADNADRRANNDPLPLAGTIEIADALCEDGDLRLSTATILAARFPYVTPSGHIGDGCGRNTPPAAKRAEIPDCSDATQVTCDGSYVDGGYAENSGLFTILAIWPSLRHQIAAYNADTDHTRKIAPLIVELDNHYQTTVSATVPSGGAKGESLIPIVTAFGGRNAMQTYARAAARRLLRGGCMITLSPSMHPGLIAPLGWELSPSARNDLASARTRPHPAAIKDERTRQIRNFRILQDGLGGDDEPRIRVGKSVRRCSRG